MPALSVVSVFEVRSLIFHHEAHEETRNSEKSVIPSSHSSVGFLLVVVIFQFLVASEDSGRRMSNVRLYTSVISARLDIPTLPLVTLFCPGYAIGNVRLIRI